MSIEKVAQQLMEAIDNNHKENQLPTVKALLDDPANAGAVCHTIMGVSPLHRAAEDATPEMLRLFLDVPGVNVNVEASNRNTPIFNAITSRNPVKVKMLVAAGADLSKRNMEQIDPVSYANALGPAEIKKILYEAAEARRR